MHLDDAPLKDPALYNIQNKLKLGRVYLSGSYAIFKITKKDEIIQFIQIMDVLTLNS